MEQVLIDGSWVSANAVDGYQAINPRLDEALEREFPVSSWDDCDRALSAALRASSRLETTEPEQIANFLVRYANYLSENAAVICQTAAEETALPLSPRLIDVEMPRTVDQLLQAADCARSESWRQTTIDHDAGIASCRGSVGPVLIFGPNNFPLAFNAISGSDFASAIAAGNPVIARGHPSHPGTTKLLAEHAARAASDAGLPSGTVQLIYGMCPEDGLRMVQDPRTAAIGFTGSRRAGMMLKTAADEVGKPIYLEMSSVNPVFILPTALNARGSSIAEALASSITMGAGQFCTCPNLFVLPAGSDAERFLRSVAAQLTANPSGSLLSKQVLSHLQESVAALLTAGAESVCGGVPMSETVNAFENTLLRVASDTFCAAAGRLQTEAFGPVSLAVLVSDHSGWQQIAQRLDGTLTASFYADAPEDDDLYSEIYNLMRRKSGRIINDKMPTGVTVSPAMNHGGPFPATGHPGFTAVGLPAAIQRFTKLDCYDNVPTARLPQCIRHRRDHEPYTADSSECSEV